ncbi:MAG: aldose epimerase family protein [Victivallaceae bacterium]
MTLQNTFFTLPDGRTTKLYRLRNANGFGADISDWGGIITALYAPDKTGVLRDVVLGYANPADYLKNSPYFGCIAGRYANRIKDGRFTLDGKTFQLSQNNFGNCLHGGIAGFDKQLWNGECDGHTLTLSRISLDGEEGFPGNLEVKVTYSITADNALQIEYFAETDAPTVINLTNHSYFNLDGEETVDAHFIGINADSYTPVQNNGIPSGEVAELSGTTLDLARLIRLNGKYNRLATDGIDHNYILNPECAQLEISAATAFSDKSGIGMEMFTTEPGVQFYTGNFLDGSVAGKNGVVYQRRGGFCFEAQHYPDSPNHANFPSTVLRSGETYRQTTIYRFSVG